MAVDYIGHGSPENLSKSLKVVCCSTQSRQLVQAQPTQECSIKTTRPVTLPPFSTTIIKGSTKLRSNGIRHNLIAEPSENIQIPTCMQCAPTYCILESGCNRVALGLRNILAKSITIPSRAVLGQLQQAKMVPIDLASK